ncbi:MAG TPA: zinc-binding dehydrogenase [Myxococcota bacterium]|nr:zinc-binding dehydrogenase [Myxococcota bacterium]
MRAIHVTGSGGPEVLKLVEVPEPVPPAGTVRICNRAVAINFHDIQTRRHGETGLTPPFIPGTDFAGLVDAVGAGVQQFRVGDRVLGIHLHGAYAEKSIALAALAVQIPGAVTFEQAAACPVAGLTAYFLVHDLRAGRGTTALVHAAGGSVGCFLGGLLRERGATAIGLVSSPRKAQVAQAAGYAHTIDYRREDVIARVRELTGGRGVDLVYDSVAGPHFARSFEACAPEGTVVLFGTAAGEPPLEALATGFLTSRRNLGLRTYFLGSTIEHRLAEIPKAFAALFEGLATGTLRVPIETLPLAEAAAAQGRIERQETVGKLVLVP